MEHLAIDLGGRKSQACVRSDKGVIVEERAWPTRELGSYLAARPKSRVILETCAEAFFVADQARELGHEVRVVPATLVRTLGVGARGLKTDKRDARVLSEVSSRIDLPSVHVPSQRSRDWKTLAGMREGLVESRTKLVNTVRGWLRASAVRVASGDTERFSARVRKTLSELPTYVERQLRAIEALSREIAEADKELREIAKADPICTRLISVPGVGAVTAVRFVAALDDVSRFESADQVASYLGLCPGENSSSDKQRRTSITKAGPAPLRWTLVQAAWAARRSKIVHPMVLWSLEVEKRRGKRIAIVALARKLTAILFALWRDGTFYCATHSNAR